MKLFDTQIIPDTSQKSMTYKMDVSQRSIFGAGLSVEDNRITQEIKKKLLSRDSDGYVYQINVNNRVQRSNQDIRDMEKDISTLQKELIVRTNDEGRITHIINQFAIREKWEDYKPTFYKKYKENKQIDAIMQETDVLLKDEIAFLKTIGQSEIGSLIFPSIYKENLEEGQAFQDTREYENFFGETSLPLNFSTILKKRDRKTRTSHFYRTGEVNEDAFEHQQVRRIFRRVADNYRLAASVKLDYMETYKLNEKHWITHGGQLFVVNIKGLFNFEQIVRFAPLT